jgi:cytochrome c553
MQHIVRIFLVLAMSFLAPAVLAAGNAERGAEKAKQVCAACHGADGNTPLQAEYPRIAGQHEDYLVKALRDYKSGARKNAIMGAQAANLSRQEMQDLAAYFSSLKGVLGVIR